MPILRLVVIYLVLILAVVAVFNRDKLARLVIGDPPAEAAAAAPAPAPAMAEAPASLSATPAPAPTVTPAPPAAPPTAPEAQPPAPARPGPGVLQTPQAAPALAPEPVPDSAPAPAPELAEALNAARAAYWAGDIAEAGAQLTALAAAHPENADLHGELGNFRFANRDYGGAAEAFLRAGELLVAEGRAAQAAGLLPVLGQIAPDKAQALATLLQTR